MKRRIIAAPPGVCTYCGHIKQHHKGVSKSNSRAYCLSCRDERRIRDMEHTYRAPSAVKVAAWKRMIGE